MQNPNAVPGPAPGLSRISACAVLAALASCASPAFADPWTSQIGVASEYIGKGLGKSDEDPALFASARWEATGVYATAFISQAASPRGAKAEAIISAGYEQDIGDWGVDVLVKHRKMVGERQGVDSGYGLRRLDNGSSYDAWNIGVKHRPTPNLAGDLRWYDTDGHDLGSRYDGRLVASLTYSF